MTTSNYTTLLGLALPTTGDLSGQWGNEVNDYISKYVDSSVAGTQTISGSQTAVTLSRANGVPLSQAGSSSTGSSQYQVINCTGNPAGTLTVTIDVTTGSPALSNSTYSQTFAVINGTSTSQSVVVRATTTSGTSTGVTLVSGEKALIAWNGSDFIKVATSTADGVTTLSFGSTGLTPSTATSGAVTVAGTLVAANGGTGQSSYTTGDLLYATGSTALSKLGIGTNGQVLTSTGTAPQWSTLSGVAVTTFSAGTTGFTPSSATSGAVTLAGTLATTNGGTGLTSFTANGVVYASSSSALTTGSALSFNGTSLTIGAGSGSPFARINGGTASGVGGGYAIDRNGTEIGGIYSGSWYTSGSAAVNTVAVGTTTSEALLFGVNYTEQMRLTSTGLGIGTSSPSAKLDIYQSSARYVRAYPSSGLADLEVVTNNNVQPVFAVKGTGNADLIRAYAGATQALTLDTSGNLGIGTSSPAVKLQSNVSRTSGQNVTALVLSDTVTGAQTSGFGTQIQGWSNNGSAQSAIGFEAYGGTNNDTALGFYTQASAGGLTRRMTISSTGDVGIGTGSPAQKLEVNGSAYLGGRGSTFAFMTPDWRMYNSSSGNALVWDDYSTERMRLNSSGNLGLGVTPSAWSGNSALQVGPLGALSGNSSLPVSLSGNAYATSAGWAAKYIANGYATWYLQYLGEHRWYTAASGTAGNTISFTQAMTLDASGNLGLGTTSPANNGATFATLSLNGSNGGALHFMTAGTTIMQQYNDANAFFLNAGSGKQIIFQNNSTERARITSTGTFQLTNNYQEGVLTANTGTAYTIDLVNGTLQILTLTGNCTFTFPTATAGQSFTMLLRQDGTGGRTVTWPAAVRWPGNTAPTITSTASQTDKYIFTADGTRWYGSNAGQAYVA